MYSERLDRDVFDFGGCFFDAHTHVNLTKLITTLSVSSASVYEKGANLLQFDSGERHRYDPRAAPITSNGVVSGLEASYAVNKIEDAAKSLTLEAPHHAQHGKLWDAQTWASFQANFVTYPVITALSAAVRAQFGAEPGEVSLLHVLHAVRANRGVDNWLSLSKGLQHKFVGGSSSFVATLAERAGGAAVIFPNTPVQSIQQGRVTARVVTRAGKAYSARYVIVAVPPPHIARMEIVPPLPPAHDQLLLRLAPGYAISAVATYRARWWLEDGLSGMALSELGPVAAVYDHSTASQPALLILVSGQKARELGYEPDAANRKRVILRHVANLLGEEALHPTTYKEKDWMADPWARGGPGAVPGPGFYAAFGDILRMPLGKLFFAFSEISSARPGTMDGAVEAGERAANEAVQMLRSEKSYLPPSSAVLGSSPSHLGPSPSTAAPPPPTSSSSSSPSSSSSSTPSRLPPPLPSRGQSGGLPSSMSN